MRYRGFDLPSERRGVPFFNDTQHGALVGIAQRQCDNLRCYRARHTGPFVGVPASGVEITMRSIDIWRVENDRFVEHWDELNLLEVFQQMGAIPAQSGAA